MTLAGIVAGLVGATLAARFLSTMSLRDAARRGDVRRGGAASIDGGGCRVCRAGGASDARRSAYDDVGGLRGGRSRARRNARLESAGAQVLTRLVSGCFGC